MPTPSAFAGRLSLVSLSDLLETMQANNTTGELRLKTDFGAATVWFDNGQLLDAKIGSFQGEAAVFRLLGLTDGSFEVKSMPVSRSRVITQPVRALLRRRSQRSQEWKSLVEKLPPLGTVLVLDLQSFSSASSSLTEEQLSVVQLVDGRRAVFEIIDESGRDAVEVLRIIEQLIARGLVSADAEGVGGGAGYRDPREDESGVLPPSSRAQGPSRPPSSAANDRLGSDPTASDRAANDRAANDRAASDRAASDRAASDRAASDRAASDRAASDRAASDRAASDRAAAEERAAEDRANDRRASDRAASDRAASDRLASERAGQDRGGRAPSEPAASSPESMGAPTQPHPAPLYKPTPVSVPSPSQIRGGPKLGRYEVLSRLGRGGMGTVYLARITGDGGFRRLFAIKVLRSHLSRNDEAGQMLLKEARIASRVDHPNIVSVVDVGSHEGQPYLVMDYVTGCSLADLLRSNKKYSTAAAVSIIIDTLAGLHAAHTLADDDGVSLDVIHHDVSPHNIMVGLDGIARLSDFGVAFVRRSIGEPEEASRGKPAFTAPERVKGGAGDRRSDVFSVGVILWNVLTGAALFDGPDIETTLENVLTRPIPPASRHGLSPDALDAVCFKALQRQPEKRYQSAEEMLVHLRKVAAGEDLLGSPSEVKHWVKEAMGHDLDVQRLSFLDASRMAREAESNLLPVRQLREEGPGSDASRTIEFGKTERSGATAKWVAVGLGVLILLVAAFWPGKIGFKRKPVTPPGPASVTAPLAPRPTQPAATKSGSSAAPLSPPAASPVAASPPAASPPPEAPSPPVAAPAIQQPAAPVAPTPAAPTPAAPTPAAPTPAVQSAAPSPVASPPAAPPVTAPPKPAETKPAETKPAETKPPVPPVATPPAASTPPSAPAPKAAFPTAPSPSTPPRPGTPLPGAAQPPAARNTAPSESKPPPVAPAVPAPSSPPAQP